MLYKITLGNTVLEKCIESVQFNVSTQNDYLFVTRYNSKNLIKITGYIDTEESTIVLYEWALLPATNPNCYKEITVEQYKSEKLLRKVTFSKAFVVKYSESYSNDEGVGTFTLYIKPLFGQDVEVTSEASSATHEEDLKTEFELKIEEEQNQNNNQEYRVFNEDLTTVKKPKVFDKPVTGNNIGIYLRDSPLKEPYNEIARFRQKAGLPPFDNSKKAGAVARIEINGKVTYGINSGFQKTTKAKQLHRKEIFDTALKEDFPWASNWSQVESLKHAEAHALLRAARKGKLPKSVTMYVDKTTCSWCQQQLPALMKHLGIEELIIYSGGSTIPIKLPK